MSFYNNLEVLCKRKKITMAALARELGLSNSATTYWKRGSIPKYETLKRIADYFGVEVEDFLNYPEEKTKALSNILDNLGKTEIEREKQKEKMINRDIDKEMQLNDIMFVFMECYDRNVIEKIPDLHPTLLIEGIKRSFYSLNSLGQKEAARRVEELTEIPRYKKHNKKNDEEFMDSEEDLKDEDSNPKEE